MGKLTSTHTYAELELSPAAYEEIKTKLKKAGYNHAFMEDGAIDMHGIGVMREANDLDAIALSTASLILDAAPQVFTFEAITRFKARIQVLVIEAIKAASK